ncbi:hypothetical protein Ahu01nite_017220 [Winogradskya humida]|uniref:Uncharacterized protein n=1 Tax=Winogradskya humida TaxID=113566 RepID=A0ABQ3ZJ65_9ACTN|nr:hypothetical protein Ahu01nite_017220 [Actinoplanes humidus]
MSTASGRPGMESDIYWLLTGTSSAAASAATVGEADNRRRSDHDEAAVAAESAEWR